MKPANFDYVRAETMEEALVTLADGDGEARVIAGGQSLGPMMNLRLALPETLVDIAWLDELKRLEWSPDGLTVGAGVVQAAVLSDPQLAARQPLLAAAMPWIGHVQTRARGTVCGSLAHADPAAELPLLFATLGGMAFAASAEGQRQIAAQDFFDGMFETTLQPEEMLTAVRFDAPHPGAGVAFREVAERHGDFAIVAVAAVADGDGLTFGVGGASDTPVTRRWDGLDAAGAADAVNALSDELDPPSDPKADAAYRRRLVRTVGLEIAKTALERRHAV